MRFTNQENNSGSSNNGIGLAGVLFVVFLVLKLTGYIAWSWLWVTSPLWIGIGLTILLAVFLVWLKG